MGQAAPGGGLTLLLLLLHAALPMPSVHMACHIAIDNPHKCSRFIISSQGINSTCYMALSGTEHSLKVKPGPNFKFMEIRKSAFKKSVLLENEIQNQPYKWYNIYMKYTSRCLYVNVDNNIKHVICSPTYVPKLKMSIRGTVLFALPCDHNDRPSSPWWIYFIITIVAGITVGSVGFAVYMRWRQYQRMESPQRPESRVLEPGTTDIVSKDGVQILQDPTDHANHHYEELDDPSEHIYDDLYQPANYVYKEQHDPTHDLYEEPIRLVKNAYENVSYPLNVPTRNYMTTPTTSDPSDHAYETSDIPKRVKESFNY